MSPKTADFIEESKAFNSKPLSKRKGHRHPNSIANLKPYPKGVSGNPGGKPKVDVARIVARCIFENNEQGIYEALGKALLKGNAYVFKELAERAYGKLTDKLELHDGDRIMEKLLAGRKKLAKERG
jgi:hypothetical protein